MTETPAAPIISVHGEHTARRAPERATVYSTVSLEGPVRAPVFDETSRAAETLRASIIGLHDATAGPVRTWSSENVHVWSHRPWNQDGEQLPLVYTASVGFTVEFDDFTELARWIERSASSPGATISGIDWALTPETEREVTEEVRTLAVADAVARASTYARAIGLETVRAIAISDPGLFDTDSIVVGGAQPRMMKAGMADSTGGGLELTPSPIEVTAAVDAKFVAS